MESNIFDEATTWSSVTFLVSQCAITLRKDLITAGFSEEKADVLVQALEEREDGLVTNKTLAYALERLEMKLTIKLYTVGIAIVGVLAALNYWG